MRVLGRIVRFATRPLHPFMARGWHRVQERARYRLEALRARLPRRGAPLADDTVGERAPFNVREPLSAWKQAGPELRDLWTRALTFAAHRSRSAAAMPYVRRYAGTSGLAWGMSGRVASPTRFAHTPTEQELAASVAVGDIAVHFRPVFRVGGGIAGAVAVLRWRHPLRGWAAADRLVEAPGTDDAGPRLLLRLLLTESARFAGAWRRSDPTFRVTLGLSRSQLAYPELASLTTTELARVQLPADAIEFEVTERTATVDVGYTAAVFRRLRDAGMRLAIDDFAGILSADEIEKIAPDAVKVDFWGSARNPNARSAVAEVVRTARPFGVEVTAKRVETPAEVDLLRELECTFTWGDAFAAPVPADQFTQAVRGAA